MVYSGALSVLDIASSDVLEFVGNANFSFDEGQAEGAPAARFGSNMQGLKKKGEVSFSIFSDQATDIRVSHLDVSAATLGAINLLSTEEASEIIFRATYDHKLKPGIGEKWEYPIVADGSLSASIKAAVPSGSATSIIHDFFSATYATLNKVLDFTVNGIQIQAPFRMMNLGMPVEKGGLIEYSLGLADRSARSGVTVLPSGTTSLLEKALNAPKTAIGFEFQPEAATSENVSGSMIIKSMEMVIRDGALIPIAYTYATQGTVTGATIA